MSLDLITWIAFVGAFLLIVLLHEGGHFVAARLLGIEIEEFGIGLPPRLWRFWRSRGWLRVGAHRLEVLPNTDFPFDLQSAIGKTVIAGARQAGEQWLLTRIAQSTTAEALPESVQPLDAEGDQWQIIAPLHEVHPGTEYTLNALPLGGFVRPRGENNPNIPAGLAAAPPWKRLIVLSAGAFMNLVLGVFVYSLIFMRSGIPQPVVYIEEVAANSPAAQSGIRPGDRLVSINGQSIESTGEARSLVYANLDRPIEIVLERGGTTVRLNAVPSSARGDQGALGILMYQPYVRPSSWLVALGYGAVATEAYVRQILTLPALWLRGQISAEEGRLIGLRGIFDFFSQAVETDVTQQAFSPTEQSQTLPPPSRTMALIAGLTITIGLFNLFPIPALDGGRILFVLAELALRRRVPPELENKIHLVGLTFLLLLMIYVNLMDFIRPIRP
ncbi:MAG: M50 family metallopeptidase [Anaerolineales bacterium]